MKERGFDHSYEAGSPFRNHEGWNEDGMLEVCKRFLPSYDWVPTEDLLAEYEERIHIFREFWYEHEAEILEKWRASWWKILSEKGEERFREELVITLSLAFHATFVIVATSHAQNHKRAGSKRTEHVLSTIAKRILPLLKKI